MSRPYHRLGILRWPGFVRHGHRLSHALSHPTRDPLDEFISLKAYGANTCQQ